MSIVKFRSAIAYRGASDRLFLRAFSCNQIEVKKACNWKHGIGQALVYQFYYPNKKPVLFLFGEDVSLYRDLAKSHCDRLGVLYREESPRISKEF